MTSRAVRYAVAASRVLQANIRPLDTPLKLTLALTYWCQYRCRTCNIWRRRPADELSSDEIFAFVDRNPGISWLDLTGGEIFLRKDVGEILQRVTHTWRRLALLHFPTNGFLTDRIASTVARLATRSTAQIVVTVSIDGDEALNDEIRGITGGYLRQVETFNALRRIAGVRPVIGMTLSAANAGSFERTFRACQAACPGLTIDDFHLNLAQVSSHYYGNENTPGITPHADAARAEIARYRAIRGRPLSPSAWLEDRYLHHLDRYLADGRTPMRCHALRSSAFVDPWGFVYPCITYDRHVGSLRETGMRLAPIWNGDTARDRQAEIWHGDCPQCWTACEAYPSIVGNLLAPARSRPPTSSPAQISPCTHETM